MLELEMAQAVGTVVNTLAGAIASDGWGAVKGRFGAWLRHHRRSDAVTVLLRLEELREEILRAQQGPNAEALFPLYDALQYALTVRLAEVIAADPAARADLERLAQSWSSHVGKPDRAAGMAEGVAREYLALLADPRSLGPGAHAQRRSDSGLPRVPVPFTAPPATARFIDREELLTSLHERIAQPASSSGSRIVNLWGEGGIGKSAVALKLWERIGGLFPHGLLYADLRGSTGEGAVDPGSAMVRFLRVLGVSPAEVPGEDQTRLDLYRELMAELAVVVLLDDAASLAQVTPLLCAAPNSLTVITSRDPLHGVLERYGAISERIPPLDTVHSVELLRAIAGLGGEAAGRAAELDARADRCAGLPLALCVQGAQWAIHGRAVAADELPVGGCSQPDAASSTDLLAAYPDLPADTARLHRLLCARPWPSITVGAAAAVCGASEADAGRMLETLYQVNLLERAPGGSSDAARYRVHEAVRRQAALHSSQEDGAAEITSSIRAVVSWYLAFAVAADWQVMARWHLGPLYAPLDQARAEAERGGTPVAARYASDTAALDVLESELGNLIEAARAADQHGFYELVCQLCESLWSVFFRRGHHDDWIVVHRLGIKAAVEIGDRRMEARMNVQLAFGFMGQDRLAEADEHFRRALVADRAAGHAQGQATALESLGLLCLSREQFAEAADLFAQARSCAEMVGNPRALALLDHHEGRALSGLGQYERAEDQFQRALEAFRALETRDEYNEGRILMSRAENALRARRADSAHTALEEAAEIMVRRGSIVQQGRVALLRAWCARELGDLVGERALLVEARELHERAGSPLGPKVHARVAFLDAATARLT